MKTLTLTKLILIALLGILAFMPLASKAAAADSLAAVRDTSRFFPQATDTGGILPLPPLDTLIKLALDHSPLMHQQDALIAKNTADAHRVKKILLDAIKLNTGVQYGNYGDP